MTAIERLIHRGYFDEASDRGDDLPGGGADDTAGGEEGDEKVVSKLESEDGDKAKKDAADEKTAADKDEDDKVKASLTVPKSRFDQAVGKARREAEEANKRATEAEAKLKAQAGDINAEAAEKELDTLEEKFDKAVADNNPELKQQIRREIRAKTQELAEARAAAHARYATAVAIEQVRYDAAVALAESEHPELNIDDPEKYDEAVAGELIELKEAFEAKGEASTVALQKALRVLYKGARAPEKQEDKKGDDTAAARRKQEAIERALEAKKKTPSDQKKAGMDSDKAGKKGDVTKDILKMTDKEFGEMDKDTLANARGDNYVGT